jgi:thiol:disulfide interchange protein DsbC
MNSMHLSQPATTHPRAAAPLHKLRSRLLALSLLGLAALLWTPAPAQANETTIRANLPQRLPTLPPIDEVRASPMPGLFEVRINQSEILYTDAQGNFLIQGALFDTRTRINLTEQRTDQLSGLAFDSLPLKDAIVTVRGNGQQRLAVFSDPNCGFCKRLDRELDALDNVTIYTFLVGLLGASSQTASRNIWCAPNKSTAYFDWMLSNRPPPKAPNQCDASAIDRNMAFAAKHRITGTPTSFMANGTRIVGADIKRIEQALGAKR